jgi:Tol biopolymer transport system component
MSMHALKRGVAWMGIAAVALTALGLAPANATRAVKNGRIVLGMDRGNGTQVYTVSPSGTGLRRLTHVVGGAQHPDWSPDGHTIVFERDFPDETCGVELMNADGTGVVNLTGHRRGCEQNPSFTPNGQRIVFVVQRCDACRQAIWTMNLQGGDRQKVRASPQHVGIVDPNVSPDGKTIAFMGAKDDSHRGLYTVSSNGKHLELIVPFLLIVGTHFDWAPDGRLIVFTEYGTGPGNTNTVRPNGSDRTALTHYRGDLGAGGAVYSADGRWILFRLQNDVTSRYSLWKMRPDGTDRTRIRKLPAKFGDLDESRKLA